MMDHLPAVGLFVREEHPSQGPIIRLWPTTRFARTPTELALPARELGQHSEQVLREAGLRIDEIAALRAKRVIATALLKS